MLKNFRVKIEFFRMGQGIIQDAFQFAELYMVVLNEEDEIAQIGFEATVYFAQRNAVWVSDGYTQVTELTDWNCSVLVSFWKRDKTLEGDGIYVDFQLFGYLDDLAV